METKDYFISTKDDKKEYYCYESDKYRLTEIELLTLIKICYIEKRSKSIGLKILEAYRDSTKDRQDITHERLAKIGLSQNGRTEPTGRTKVKSI